MSGSLGSVILQRLIKAHLRMSCFHAPFFFFPLQLFDVLTAGNIPSPHPSLKQEQLCHRDHTPFKAHLVTLLSLPSHCTSRLTLSPFRVPFPVQGSPWQDAALHPALVSSRNGIHPRGGTDEPSCFPSSSSRALA